MDDPRIPDEFYRRLITMYRGRAVFWRRVSIALLVSTFLFVISGIVMFYMGDERAATSEREVEIKTELRIVREQMRDVLVGVDLLESKSINYQNAKLLCDRLAYLVTAINNLSEKTTESSNGDTLDSDLLDELSGLKVLSEDCSRIIENIESVRGGEDESRLNTVRVDASSNRSITADAYKILIEANIQIDWSSAKDKVAELVSRLGNLSGDFSTEDFGRVQNVAKMCVQTDSPVAQFNLLQQSIDGSLQYANDELTSARANFNERQVALAELRNKEEQLTKELDAIVGDRNYILFMAWIPDLTVRIGAVILLLFITKILLVTYRYTASLSSYYLGIADAIQLLQPAGPDVGWYKIEHLTQLLTHLVPSNLAIDSVATPTDQLSDLAKAWISKKTPG